VELARFVSDHLLPLREELAGACAAAPPSSAGRRYLAEARLLALRLWQRDRALSPQAWRRFAPPCAASQLAAALGGPDHARGSRRRLLRADLLYLALRVRGWLVGGAARKPDDNPGHDLLA
jgi:hypothetical protein